jgi:hypothetical protein
MTPAVEATVVARDEPLLRTSTNERFPSIDEAVNVT